MTGAPILFGSVAATDAHDTGPGHPERPSRLDAVERGVRAGELDGVTSELVTRPAVRAELLRVHSVQYLDALERLAVAGGGQLDPDTPVAGGSWATAVASAGLGLAAIEALRRNEGDAAFVAPRPPGHHATASRGMGFCLLNNVAVAAAALAADGERVVIVDWDVHHGNGTQDVFWNDPRVLYASMHEAPGYPGTGAVTETGGHSALGATVNVPLPSGATGDVALAAIDEVIGPVAASFGPTWVLVSAGFDAHRDDPLAGLAWSSGDYATLTTRVLALAPGRSRTIVFLEGGYDLRALERSVTATVGALAGLDLRPEPATSGGPGRLQVVAAAAARGRLDDWV
ncbi:histone deacetylase [soil metagenome]